MGIANPDTPMTRAWLSLSALEDAVHYARQQPLETIDREQLDKLTCSLYMSAGLNPEASVLLYSESVDRHADRLKVVYAEVIG